MLDKQLLFLDTNVFIYLFQGSKQYGKAVTNIFTKLAAGKSRAITSVITQAELLSFAAPEDEVNGLLQLFLETPNLQVVQIDAHIATTAARLRRKYGFRLPDALQLAAAIECKAGIFVTADSRLKACREIRTTVLKPVK
ncbi:MAG: PIN domain-containing protein [bacterium]|nr:PIN domain-containing protein [bacterium]